MGSKFSKSVISESVRNSLTGWQRRVKAKHGSTVALLNETTTFSDSPAHEIVRLDEFSINSMEGSSSRDRGTFSSRQQASISVSVPLYKSYSDDDGNHEDEDDDDGGDRDNYHKDDIKDDSFLLPPP